jgi:tetratricopeptide (TPR) repeat protein
MSSASSGRTRSRAPARRSTDASERARAPRGRRAVALAAGVVALTVVAYRPAFRAGWVWDDDSYVTANAALRSWEGLRRIWVEPGAVAQYYPLTFSTLWVEYQLHGTQPAGYHATNVALHATNAVLVGLVLDAVAVPAPWAAAVLFAVHPMHVESVAWVTERKNVLSGLGYLLAFLLVLRWRRERDAGRAGHGWYAGALACFVAALLSKTVVSTLPVVYLIAQWWRTGRVRRDDVVAMLPFVVAGLLLGSVTAQLERTHVGAIGPYWDQTFAERVLVAGRALWFYVATLLVPWPLAFIYPRWVLDVASPAQWLFPVLAAGVGLGLVTTIGRLGRAPFAAALAFAVTLGPALGFVSVYPMRYSFVADHFAYLASVPFLALVAGAGAARVGTRFGRAVLVAATVVLGALTWQRSAAFHDAATLWADTIAKNPGATIAYLNLGYQRHQEGRHEEAIALFDRGLAFEPDAADLLNDRALALGALGRTDEAIAAYEHARRADPTHVESRTNLGNLLASTGRLADAEIAFREALALRPRFAEAHNNLANVLALRGDTAHALEEYARAIALDPGYADAHRNMGEVLLAAARPAEACDRFAAALAARPADVAATIGRLRCLDAVGRGAEAIALGTAALRAAPRAAGLRLALARVLDGAGRHEEAATRYREAIALDPSLAEPARP